MHSSTTSVPAHFPFWDWSLTLYGHEDVAAACLTLQDRLGLDVNLVLFAIWLAIEGRALDTAATAAATAVGAAGKTADEAAANVDLACARLRELSAEAGRWQAEVVGPLRASRRQLRAAPQGLPMTAVEALRSRVKAAELEAEQMEQWLLQQAAAALPVTRAAETSTGSDATDAGLLAHRHLAALLQMIGARPDEADHRMLALIVAQALTTTSAG